MTTSLERLADAIINAHDFIAAFDAAARHLTPADRRSLCLMLDLCPTHECDIQICLDDERTDCDF